MNKLHNYVTNLILEKTSSKIKEPFVKSIARNLRIIIV